MFGAGGWLYGCCEVRGRRIEKKRECLIQSRILFVFSSLDRTCGTTLMAHCFPRMTVR